MDLLSLDIGMVIPYACLILIKQPKRMIKLDRQKLLSEVEAFLVKTGMKHTVFGRLACGNHKVVGKLRLGGGVMQDTANEIRSFIKAHKNVLNS